VIDNLETLPDPERVQLYKFLSRLPDGCKAIVTSRRRSDVDARVIRVDRLDLKDALSLIGELAKTNRSLAAATLQERQMLYEFTGGNPLLLGWTAGQLGRRSSQCRTVADACAFLKNASAENDPLEYIFGDLLDTFTSSETAVLAVLTHFTLPAEAKWIAECSGLAQQQAQVALEDLADRALIAADPSAHTFYLPPLAAKFLGDKRPEAVAQTGERLAVRAHAQAIENGYLQYERFSVLEAQWPLLSAAIPWLVKGENERLQTFCNALRFFLEFSGRWDDWQSLEAQGEQKAVASNDLPSAGWRAFQGGWVSMLRHETAQVLLAADRAEAHWRNSGEGSVMANALRLRGFGRKFENDTPAAFEAFQKALDLFRQVDAESDDVGNVLNDLAGLQRGSGALAEAEKNYLESLRIARKNGNNEGIAICTGNLGNLARSRRDWSLMEKFSREALSLSDQLGRSELIGSNCERLALALARQGRPADGLPYVKRAIDIFRKLGQKDRLGDAEASLKECEAKPAASRPS
jgi:tetratricopeptide (TPR) repeat protein